MPEPSTPGQVAYHAYLLVMVSSRELPLWHALSPQEWFAWEAAAEAVLAQHEEDSPHA